MNQKGCPRPLNEQNARYQLPAAADPPDDERARARTGWVARFRPGFVRLQQGKMARCDCWVISTCSTRLLVALLTNGHVLLEGAWPGLAKGRLALKTLANCIALEFKRLPNFTPGPCSRPTSWGR